MQIIWTIFHIAALPLLSTKLTGQLKYIRAATKRTLKRATTNYHHKERGGNKGELCESFNGQDEIKQIIVLQEEL